MSYPSYGPEGAQYRPPENPAPVYPHAVPAPTSVPPATTPTSGPPTVPFTGPYPPAAPPPAAPSAPLGRNGMILAVLCAVLFTLAGIGFGLYLNERGELGDTRTELQEQREIVTQRDATIADAEKRATDLTTTLDTTKDTLAETTEERDALVPCMRGTQDIFTALREDNDDKLGRALDAAEEACGKAEAKLDS
ncbi:hypothetical protein [Catenuloplanes japonicus]|uniref:hypothetical protein n=1 Tax=Catenuloplanes japonicus TaxID=33876 RepID=UPI00068BCF25|nr:hypothetical protein [Catenuloplanes japonicus]